METLTATHLSTESDPLERLLLEPLLWDRPETMHLLDRMMMHGVPGLSVALIDDGRLAWARAYGVREVDGQDTVTPETRFQAGSISKAVTATAVMRLVQEGRLDLDEDVNAYLRSWQVPPNGDWQPRITLRQLLSHSAGTTMHGFFGYSVGDALPSEAKTLDGLPPANTRPVRVNLLPGTQFRYSGGGTVIVQLVLADVMGEPFPQLMRALVLDPLDMKQSSFEQPASNQDSSRATGHHIDHGIVHGRWRVYPEMAAAGLWSTPSDLGRWMCDLLRAYRGEQGTLLAHGTVRTMTVPQIELHVGLGLFLHGRGDGFRFGHEGDTAGFQAEVFGFPSTGAGWAVMCNSDTAQTLRRDVVRTLATDRAWADLAQVRQPTPDAPPDLQNLAGVYRLLDEQVRVVHQDAVLHLHVPGQAAIRLVPREDTAFMCAGVNAEVVFQRGPTGAVHGFVLRQDGREMGADRVQHVLSRWPGAT